MRRGVLFGTLGALILLLVSLVQATALLPSCGLRLENASFLDFCPDPGPTGPSPELAAEHQRRATLEARLRDLERRLAGLPACRPAPPPPPPPPPDPNRLDAERWAEQDIALLEGCWSLASDHSVRNHQTGETTTVDSLQMCFDAEGNGEQQYVLSDGTECTNNVTAAFTDGGRLRISDLTNVACTDRSYIYQTIHTCTLEPNGEADCAGIQPEINQRSRVRIKRRESS